MNDFVYLNVPSLLERYGHDAQWNDIVRRWTKTQIEFFKANGLLQADAPVWSTPAEKAVIRFHEFTPEGQDFVMSQAVEKWLATCDRAGDPAAYADASGLDRRLRKFRKARSA